MSNLLSVTYGNMAVRHLSLRGFFPTSCLHFFWRLEVELDSGSVVSVRHLRSRSSKNSWSVDSLHPHRPGFGTAPVTELAAAAESNATFSKANVRLYQYAAAQNIVSITSPRHPTMISRSLMSKTKRSHGTHISFLGFF